MFITKITLSPEDKQSILELQKKCNELFLPIEKIRSEHMTPEQVQQANEAYFKVSRQLFDLREDIRRRYIAELSKDKAQALKNASEILDAYTIEDYRKEAREARTRALERIEEIESLLNDVPAYKESPDVQKEYNYWKIVKETSGFNFTGAYHRLSTITVYEREALLLGEHGEKELDDLIYKKASSFYKPRGKDVRQPEPESPPIGKDGNFMLQAFAEQAFMPVFNTPVTNLLPATSFAKKNLTIVRGGNAVLSKNNVTVTLDDYINNYIKLKPSTWKLYDTAVSMLVSKGHVPGTEETVHFSLKDYAIFCNVYADPFPCDTAKEYDAEKARAKKALKEFRKQVVAPDLAALAHIMISTKEIPLKKGEAGDFMDVRLISEKGIRNGEVLITFPSKIADHLYSHGYIMQLPKAALALPNTNPNAYPIIRKLSMHHSMDNNVMAGTASRIKVANLLKGAPEIQSYEDMIASGNRNWKSRIKKPLEDALNLCQEYGCISEWHYCGPNNSILTPEELGTTSFDIYKEFLVSFTMDDAPAQKERRAKKAKEKKAAAAIKARELAKLQAKEELKKGSKKGAKGGG